MEAKIHPTAPTVNHNFRHSNSEDNGSWGFLAGPAVSEDGDHTMAVFCSMAWLFLAEGVKGLTTKATCSAALFCCGSGELNVLLFPVT